MKVNLSDNIVASIREYKEAENSPAWSVGDALKKRNEMDKCARYLANLMVELLEEIESEK